MNPQELDPLSVIAQSDGEQLKACVDRFLPKIKNVEVIRNRTGLVMLPYTDTVKGAVFHLGEVLLAEAWVSVEGVEGYGAVMGRDLEQALAVAIVDAVSRCTGGPFDEIQAIVADFVAEQRAQLVAADDLLLKQVEATRVEMETF